MKTLEQLKKELDDAYAAWDVANDAADAAYDAYHKKLKEESTNEDS